MSNSNVVVALYGGTGRNQLLSQTLASGTETEIKVGTDSGSTTTIAVLSMPVQSAIVGSQTPFDQTVNPANLDTGFGRLTVPGVPPNSFNSGVFDNNKPFLVRVCGVATPASNAGNTLDLKLYLGTSKSGTKIADTGAVPQATTTTAVNFILESQCVWDSTSQAVTGQFWFRMPGTSGTRYATWAQNSNDGSSIATPASLQFCISSQWGNAIGGVVAVSEFSITQL